MSDGGDPLRVLGGILLLVFGLCLLLVGGLCTWLILLDIRSVMTGGGVLAVLTLGTLALAIVSIIKGSRMIGGPKP
jgi:hypothetical protein